MINFDELKCYADYKMLKGEDIIEFMKTKPREDIIEFQNFCKTPKETKKEDGTIISRDTNFFEMRNWVLDKYYPGLTTPQKVKTVGHKLIDDIMAL